MLKLLFFGSSKFPTPILNKVHTSEEIQVVGLVTSPHPDKKSPEDIFNFATDNKIKIYQPTTLKVSAKDILDKTKPDIILVANYGLLLPKKVINYPKYKCLNVHASLLPILRGACPIEMAIIHDLRRTGVTIQIMEVSLDTGDILFQDSFPITKQETGGSLQEKIQNITIDNIEDVILGWIKGEITPQEQDNSKATYCQRTDISKEKARIHWDMPSEEIDRLIRGFYPRVIAWTEFKIRDRIQRIKILKARSTTRDVAENPGQVLMEERTLYIQSSEGSIIPKEVQPEGKKVMTIKQFLNGIKDIIVFQ